MNARTGSRHLRTSEPVRTDHLEEADNYRGELFRHGTYRVAECRDGIQWLLQRQSGARTVGGARWRSLAYCTTRSALTRLYQAHSGSVAPELAEFPETINRGRKR